MDEEYITVSQLNNYLKNKFNHDPQLRNIYIKGEISNYKHYKTSGFSYFTLKDEKSEIRGIIPPRTLNLIKFKPEDGMNVIIKGTIEVYPKKGQYQLKANKITEDGLGDLHVAFEQLKKKLNKEGLFNEEHKKEIPKFPKKIGVVTAKNSAAIKDIITTIKRRWNDCEIILFPTMVQGELAAGQISMQIKKSDQYNLDILIVGRGGGSIEDLWSFNEEIVARSIFECRTPVISGVGHETDWTITDLVADLRAPTPTAAAELAVPKVSEIENQLNQLNLRLNKTMKLKIAENKTKLKNIREKQIIKNPETLYEFKAMELDSQIQKLDYSSKNIINNNKNKLTLITQKQILKNPKTIYELKTRKLENQIQKLDYSSKNIINNNKNKLTLITQKQILKNPESIYESEEEKLDKIVQQLNYKSKEIISLNKNKLEIIKNSGSLKNPKRILSKKRDKMELNIDKLDLLNPLLTLKRGYTLTKRDDKIISSVKDVNKDDEIEIEFKDGKVNTKVI